MVDDRLIQILHKFRVIFCILLLPGDMVQNRRSIDRLCQRPVHPVVNHRLSVPVRSVHDSRSAVCLPRILHRPVIKIFRNGQISPRLPAGASPGGKGPLNDQPRPLDAMSRSRAVWFERVIRLLSVAFQIRNPFLCEMLRNPPLIPLCPSGYMVNDTAGPHPVFLIACNVCCGQKSLHRMHIGVQTPVIIQNREPGIPGITGKSFLFVPEPQIIKRQRLVQKFLCSRPPGKQRRRRSENHKRMGIALLRGHNISVRRQTCIPSAVFRIMEFPPQSFQAGICQLTAARMTEKQPQAVHMYHTAGDPCLPVSVLPGRSIVSEIIRAPSRRRKLMSELQQILLSLLQETAVFLCINAILFTVFLHKIIFPFPRRGLYELFRRNYRSYTLLTVIVSALPSRIRMRFSPASISK